ncbi:uncharacterized protein LOC135225850 [Macrobrachium nipponense]|uniref:uncharacterized protein LOC135225850 n=1 Tax=Macrobrachium nipponense TaxID=159736 RepID=UPI0030C8A534
MKVALLACLAFLASTALAAPAISSGSCALHCTNPVSFAYETGKSYVYDYSAETSASLLGVAGDDAKMKITSVAHIDVSGPCEYILRLSNVVLEGSSHTAEFAEALSKNPLKFSFQDGMIENICSEVSEPMWVLNIKRGLLSTFQNTMTFHGDETLQEKDVSGVCETDYKSVTEGNVVHVERITNINSCSERPDFSTFITSSSYNTDSLIQNINLLKTTNFCHQKLQDDIMISAECEEIYKARPFGEGQEVAMTKVKTTLVLKSQEPVPGVSDFEFYRKSLVYEDVFEPAPAHVELVEKILNDLITSSHEEVKKETPALFSKLVDALKNLDYSQLSQLLGSTTEPKTHKFLVDAMPLVGTASSMAVVRDLIINGKLNNIEKDIWFTSLVFNKHPTVEMLNAIAPLLKTNPSQKAFLGTSALINNFCKLQNTCEQVPVVKEIINNIEIELGAGCRTTNEDEREKVLVALKALGNAGHWVTAKSVLETCYLEENDMEIRVAALDAWRHTPCEYDRSNILALFQDESYDPELRIAAYLSLMSCPTPSFIDIVKERLISEGVNQVGSFIWTHMTNLQESAAPEKQWMHHMIGEELLQKKFSSDALRFSRNYESSFFMNDLNIGASVESNVIFNTKSYLPRSAMLNLTLDLFGESINFFEIGGRIDGFEAYIERFFGSNGYFPEEHIEQVLRTMRSKSNAESTTLEGFLDKISDEPEGSYYLRLFGNDLHYHHFHGMENFLSSSTSSPLDLLLDLVRQGKVDYTKSFQIMDSHINIPTISGLPLILDSKMTGTFGLEMTSNFQAKGFSDFNVQGHLHPSAALEFDGLMLIDAHLSKTGVKMCTTLHTSTLLDGKVQIQEGKVVDIAINTPKDKIEIFDVQGEFFYLTDDHEEKKETEGRKLFDGCSSDVLGLAICGTTQVSPLGPFAADVYLKKTGTQTGYIFQFKQQSDKFELLVDTPGSLEDHKIAITITKAPNSITADIYTPIKSAKGTLEYIWTNSNKKMKCALILDSGDTYAIETSLLKTAEDVTVFAPSIVLTMPYGEILNIQGIVKTKLDYYDTKIFTKLNTVYEMRGQHTFQLEAEVIKTLTDSMSTYSLRGAIDPSQYPELKASVDLTFTEVEHQQYKTEVNAVIKGKTYMFEGKLQDNSVRGKFNVIADASIVAPSLDIKGTLGIYADSEKANTNLHILANGQNYGLKLEGTKSSVLIEANVIRHILLNAYVSESPELKKLHVTGEWNKDVDPTASFLIEGQISGASAMAHVKFLEQEATFKCTLLDNAINLEGIWNGKTATALISYSLGETKSISVLVQTPFTGLEKQEATVLVTLKNYEINSQFTASWKNSQQITLNVVGKLEPGRTSNALHSEIIFSSSLPHFEHVNLKLEHEMKEDSIKTDLLATWNNWKITSAFQLLHNSDGIQSNLSLDTPFTEKILINLNHVLSNNDLTSIIEAKYGEKVVSVNIKGVVVLGLEQDINLTLKINIPLSSVSEITALINYKFNWQQLSLDFEGIMQDKKAMFHLNGELSVAESTQLVGDLRFITPFNHPVTATLEHVSNMEELETKFELTRFWSNYGNLKFHAKGNMKSANDIVLLADFFTPSTKASLSINHKVTDTKMISTLDVHFNADKITVYLNGLLDVSKSLANMEAIIGSTISGLDDLKVTIDTSKNGKDRITKMIFTKMEQSVTIDHVISVTDIWNWENTFTINRMYKLKNVHSYSGTLSKHDMEWQWDTKSVHLDIIFDNKSSGNVNKFDTVVTLETPWTGTEEIKAEVHHEDDGVQYKPVVILEYVPGRKLELETLIVFGKVFSYESILRTPFMETLAYKMKLDLSPRKIAHLILSLGEKHITLDVTGELHNGKMDSSLNIQSTFLNFPVTAAASYDFISSEKNIHLIATYGKKFEITGLLTGSINEGNWSLIADIPLDVLQHIELTGKWVYNTSKVNIEVNSHVTSFENMTFEVMYDVNEKNGEAKMTYGTKAIHLTGKYEAETIALEVVTPFNGWEKMKVSLFLSETAVNAFVSKNDKIISVKGSLHVKLEKGTINLAINTPFTGYEEISATIVYSLRGPVKQIKLDSTFATGQISLLGVIDLSKDLSPMMKLEVTTPFEVVKKIGGEATWDLSHTMKTAVIKAHRNDHHYHWQLEVSSEALSKVHIKSEITTPFEGWTNVLLQGNTDLTKMPYSFKFALDKEGAVHEVEGNFNLENNAIAAQLMTPIPGLEVIDLSGTFSWEENHFTGNFEATKSGDKFHLTTDILLNTSKPKLHIILETPIPTISKVELVFDSNLVDSHKSLLFTFTLNGTVYSLNFEGEMVHKNGYVKILVQSPITGFSAVDIHAKYDLTRDIKTAEADFKIEDDSKHFYLKTSVQKNNFHIEIHTPFKGFELIKMIGDYSAQNDKHTVLASFEKDHMKYDYNADVTITDYSVSIGFSTPMEMIKNVVVNLKYELYKNGIESMLHFKRNEEIYEMKTRAIFTPMKSELLVGVKTPFANWEKLSLDVKYDILSEMKLASLFIQKGSFEKTITVEGEYTMNSGAIKLHVPIQGYEVLGASYTLNLKDHNRKLEASLKMYMNSNEWNFSVHGEYAPNKITIMFQTPFDAVKSIIVDGNIEFNEKSGYLNIELGTYKFNVQLSYAVNDIVIQLTTPFDILKLIYFGFTYHWTESQKDATLTVTYNENNYVLQGILNLSPRTSEVSLQATSPVPGFGNVAMMIKYDIDNLNEIIMSKMTTDQYEYFFKLGAGTEGTQAHLNWDFTSTFSGWNHVQFLANVNWSPDQRTFEISLGKGDNLKAISISGHLTGFSEGSLNIHTPFIGMEKMGGHFKFVPGEKLVGKLDLHLPFYLIPKIEGEVKLDLNGKINGDAHLNIAGELYTMKCNLVGSSFEEGYSGTLMIYTPIHDLSRIVLNGNIFIKALNSLQAHMKIELPSGVYELDLKGDFALGESSFLLDLDTTVMNVNRKLTVDAKYPSLKDLEVTCITVLESRIHKIHGKFNVATSHTEGALVFDSPIIEGSRQISFDITFPSETNQHVSLAVTLVASAQHSFKLELNLMNGVEFLFKADSPLFETFSVVCKASTDTAVVMIETPSGVHKIQASWRLTYKMPADYLLSLETSSPLLPSDFVINTLLNGDKSSMNFKTELMVGGEKNVIEGSYSLAKNAIDFSLNVESPPMNINKATLAAVMAFTSTVKMQITGTFNGEVNTFDLVYEKETRNFHVEITSPFIPTGMARGEGQITGEMLKDMKIKMALLNNEQTISGVINMKALSQDDMKINVVITTPFTGYKKMKFGAQYMKNEETKIVFFVDKPVKFNTEVLLKNTEKEVRVFLNVETPIEDLKKIEGEMRIPFNAVAPKISADVVIGGARYGGHFTLRTKAPFELGAGYKFAEKSHSFHIKTDSSFFSMFA